MKEINQVAVTVRLIIFSILLFLMFLTGFEDGPSFPLRSLGFLDQMLLITTVRISNLSFLNLSF